MNFFIVETREIARDNDDARFVSPPQSMDVVTAKCHGVAVPARVVVVVVVVIAAAAAMFSFRRMDDAKSVIVVIIVVAWSSRPTRVSAGSGNPDATHRQQQ